MTNRVFFQNHGEDGESQAGYQSYYCNNTGSHKVEHSSQIRYKADQADQIDNGFVGCLIFEDPSTGEEIHYQFGSRQWCLMIAEGIDPMEAPEKTVLRYASRKLVFDGCGRLVSESSYQ